MKLAKHSNKDIASRELVLTKAVLSASDKLGINSTTLGKIIGLSAATISRMKKEGYSLKTDKKEYELGAEFVRLYRGIDSINGGDDTANQSWIKSNNTVLNGAPIDLIQKIRGLVHTIEYVDTFRAKI
ncbi:MAG: DUF2384 domain-containing protein [Kordiimonadaceae bacterium]|nr:DUF2384 domain-containing protein [Kordiimonadaceae bacterium]